MKRLTLICFLLIIAGAWVVPAARAADTPADASRQKDDGAGGSVTIPDRDADSGIQTEKDEKEGPGPGDEGLELKKDATKEQEEPPKKEFVSVRRKRNPFSFHAAFSIGGIGYGVMGPRQARSGRYQFRYEDQSFMAGFRGGFEALFYITKLHCVSVGAFYEQRRVQIKIADVAYSRMLFSALTIEQVYSMNLVRYVDKSNVDTNYVALPVGYRFHVMDELYLGLCLDVAVAFQAKANYSIINYSTSLDLMKYLQKVDFGGRVLLGFTMNRVFIEIGIGCGFLNIDLLPGQRHTMNVIGMVGYRL